jgi:hypothetical protein
MSSRPWESPDMRWIDVFDALAKGSIVNWIKDGFDVNGVWNFENHQRRSVQSTPLLVACGLVSGVPPNFGLCAFLLDNGADSNKSHDGQTPLNAIVCRTYSASASAIVSLLLQRGATGASEALLVFPYSYLSKTDSDAYDVLETLLAADGIDVNFRNREGKTPLMIAIECNLSIDSIVIGVRRLLAAGADPHLKDNRGKSALHYAERIGR